MGELVKVENFVTKMFDGHEVRITDKNGHLWFVAKDVALALEYSNPEKAVRDHCRMVNEAFTPSNGGQQLTKIIPEGEMYRLVMRANTPEAERFQDWVCNEVLPELRKNGSYITTHQLTYPQALRQLADAVEKKEKLEKQLKVAEPKAKAFDDTMEDCKGVSLKVLANALAYQDLGQNNLIKLMRSYRLIDKRNAPIRKWEEAGYFYTKIVKLPMNKSYQQTFVTPKGIPWIIDRLDLDSKYTKIPVTHEIEEDYSI